MEAEVGNLLDVVSQMEDGDLTVQAEVSDRATGLVADTLNRLAEQLASTIAGVLVAAREVASGARDLEEAAQLVASNTVEQAKSVARGQELTEQVAEAARASAAQTERANIALTTARQTSDTGRNAIEKLITGIEILQVGTGQIVQKMKTLGEFVGLAEQFVQDQGQIASLTQVLAINATLVAARAAEQRDPKQFIGVAREFEALAGQVNALATQTNEGLSVLQQRTAQIQSVVSAVDGEVQQLGNLVQGFTSGVQQSSEAFSSVQTELAKAVEAGRQIAQTSVGIAAASASTANYMSEIAKLAERTAELTRNTRRRSENMEFLAQQLLAGIGFFRVPEAALSAAAAAAPKLKGESDRPELPAAYTETIAAMAIGEEPAVDYFAKPLAGSTIESEVGDAFGEDSGGFGSSRGDGTGLRAWKVELLDEPVRAVNGTPAVEEMAPADSPAPFVGGLAPRSPVEPLEDPSPMTQIFQAASRQVGAIFQQEAEPLPSVPESAEIQQEAIAPDAKAGAGRSILDEDTQIELPDVGGAIDESEEAMPFDFGQFQATAPAEGDGGEGAATAAEVSIAPEPPVADLVADLTAGLPAPKIRLDAAFEMPEISFEPDESAAGASLFDMLESELEDGSADGPTGLFEELAPLTEAVPEATEDDPFGDTAANP
ncbi:MAG: methyl-accepting chemotaxis protein [Oscillatoriales cyanobacterium SM2_1_8]|nr:methyl-accepting chemotaxis protein [Oscillatoriales cyanobacterium SM2_1_8]